MFIVVTVGWISLRIHQKYKRDALTFGGCASPMLRRGTLREVTDSTVRISKGVDIYELYTR